MPPWWKVWSVVRRNIRIERLEVRLRGVAPEPARAAVRGLGRELAERLGEPQNSRGGAKAVRIVGIDAGTSRLPDRTGASELRSVIAHRVAASIAAKLGRGAG